MPALRAERDSQANLPGALRHQVRKHPINADDAEQQS